MMNKTIYHPSKEDIQRAAIRISPHINHTPVMKSETINTIAGANLLFKCENFQKAGAFKSRGAVNAIFSFNNTNLKAGVGTHSSGNHAQALARAAALKNIPAYIVMPENAPMVKVNAVRSYGGIIKFCKPTLQDRESELNKLIKEKNLIEIHPYNNLKIIEGQATAAKELIEEIGSPDIILCPVGGGGLLSGTALSARFFGKNIKVIAVEPKGADDAKRSFEKGYIIPSINPNTIADGLRTSLGDITFPIIYKYVDDIVTVSEEAIIEAMKLIWERMKIVVEPSAAVTLAAILENKINSGGMRVGIIISGGNTDLNNLPWKENY